MAFVRGVPPCQVRMGYPRSRDGVTPPWGQVMSQVACFLQFPAGGLSCYTSNWNWTQKWQESPPAWMQEAYRPSCSEYSFCCPNWVPPPAGYPPILLAGGGGTLPGGTLVGYPWQGTPPAGHPPAGYPPWQGTPQLHLAGHPPPPSWTWQSTPPQVSAPWHSGKCCKALWDMGTPPQCLPHGILGNVAKHYGICVPPPPLWTDRWMEGQTRVKTLPSRRTAYAGGKYLLFSLSLWNLELIRMLIVVASERHPRAAPVHNRSGQQCGH